jgi:hypothetical protein
MKGIGRSEKDILKESVFASSVITGEFENQRLVLLIWVFE